MGVSLTGLITLQCKQTTQGRAMLPLFVHQDSTFQVLTQISSVSKAKSIESTAGVGSLQVQPTCQTLGGDQQGLLPLSLAHCGGFEMIYELWSHLIGTSCAPL